MGLNSKRTGVVKRYSANVSEYYYTYIIIDSDIGLEYVWKPSLKSFIILFYTVITWYSS